jgi:uncharacterized protein (DUF2141 family)
MRHLLLAGLLSACALTAQPAPGTGTIEGHVFNSLTGAPVRKVTVTLTAPQIRLVANTDTEGQFQFAALPAGTYKLSATQPGFLDRAVRRPISLAPDDHATGVEIRLPPQGLITGHVVDEDGDPVGGAQLAIFKQIYLDGEKQWARWNGATANETGEYRVPNLKPGRYLVEAHHPRGTPNNYYGDPELPDKPKLIYLPAYYPNAASQEAALPVEVGVGSEVRGIDIHFSKVPRLPYFHVRGKITGVPPKSQLDFIINLLPSDRTANGGSTAAIPPDYLFDASVAPGQYKILAYVYSGGPEAFATGTVTVTQDVTGLTLAMSPAAVVTGRVTIAESSSKVSLKGLQISLKRLKIAQNNPEEVRSDAGGKFSFVQPIWPAHHAIDVNVRSIPDGCFIQSVKLGGQEVSPDDFEILNSTQLDIVLSNTAGKITGIVSDDDSKPFPNASVTLIPQDGNSRPVKQLAGDNGNFTFTALRPGKYKLFAWEELDEDFWQDPEFRKKYEDRATEITVSPSETQNAQLRLIAAGQMK